jgi:hypothetical protein
VAVQKFASSSPPLRDADLLIQSHTRSIIC